MRFNIFFSFLVFSLFSCGLKSNTPKCGDEEVVKLAVDIFNDEIKDKLKDKYISDNFNKYDAIEYANNKGWDAADYIKKEEERVEIEADENVDKILRKTHLKNIRSNKIEKEIKLCNCSAEVENINLNKIEVDYSVQRTEDKDQSIYIELSYIIK